MVQSSPPRQASRSMKRYFLLVKVLNNLKKKQKCLVQKMEITTQVGRAFSSDFWIGYVGIKKKNTDQLKPTPKQHQRNENWTLSTKNCWARTPNPLVCCFEVVQSWVGFSRKATKWKILPRLFQTVSYLTMKGLLASIMIRFSFMICSCCLVSTMWCFFRVFIANVLLSLASWTWKKFTSPLSDAVLKFVASEKIRTFVFGNFS